MQPIGFAVRQRATRASAAIIAAAVLACSGWSSAPDQGPIEDASLQSSRVSVLVTGGIAGIWIRYTVDGVGPTWTVETRDWHCGVAPECLASRSGPLEPEVARTLFEKVDGWFFLLRSDYGQTPGAADLFGYVVGVRRGDQAKTVSGDQLSVPEPVNGLVGEVRRVVEEAEAP